MWESIDDRLSCGSIQFRRIILHLQFLFVKIISRKSEKEKWVTMSRGVYVIQRGGSICSSQWAERENEKAGGVCDVGALRFAWTGSNKTGRVSGGSHSPKMIPESGNRTFDTIEKGERVTYGWMDGHSPISIGGAKLAHCAAGSYWCKNSDEKNTKRELRVKNKYWRREKQ